MPKKLNTTNKAAVTSSGESQNYGAELILANQELARQVIEKEKYAEELTIANAQLLFQNQEKEKRAQELMVANAELAFQNNEKEKRAAELVIANTELAFQNQEKENRAAELVIANAELAFQNEEKEKRAAELVVANAELAFQNQEKEKRAAELVIANAELAFQNQEKEKRAAELLIANKELESFTFISNHDLQEPLRKIQAFSTRILDEEYAQMSEKGKYYIERMQLSALHMQSLINDLLTYSQTNSSERKFEHADLNKMVREVMEALKKELQLTNATIELHDLGKANIIPLQFRQLLQNLISNSLKFQDTKAVPHITIKSDTIPYNHEAAPKFIIPTDHYRISISDNGIGFDQQYKDKIFEIFQKLHGNEHYNGTGIGLTIVKKIVENHNGIITATGSDNDGATFDIYIPVDQSTSLVAQSN